MFQKSTVHPRICAYTFYDEELLVLATLAKEFGIHKTKVLRALLLHPEVEQVLFESMNSRCASAQSMLSSAPVEGR